MGKKNVLQAIEDEPCQPMDLNPAILKIDDSYQRGEKSIADEIAANFKWHAFQTLCVGRRVDGTLWVVDGQQRQRAALIRGMTSVPCSVFESTGPEHEAEMFSRINGDKALMSKFDIWKSDLRRQQPEAVAINNAILGKGFEVVASATARNHIQCPGALRWIYRSVGLTGLREVLQCVKTAWHNAEGTKTEGALAEDVLQALALVLKTEPTMSWVRMAQVLSKQDLAALKSEARGLKKANSGFARYRCLAIKFMEAYNNRLGAPKKLKVALLLIDEAA